MPRIDGARLLADLKRMAEFGRYKTGVHRPMLSEPDIASRHWLVERMQEAGLVYELRPGRFGLTFDLAELESRHGPEQTHIVISGGNAVPELMPARRLEILPQAEQLQTWLMAHRHSLNGGRRYAVA